MRYPDIEVNGHRYVWAPGTTVEIGRDPACDIVLDNPKVSRNHVKVEATPEGAWRLVDSGSTNGTWVDGRRVGQLVITSSETVTLGPASNGAVLELVLVTEPDDEAVAPSDLRVPGNPAPESATPAPATPAPAPPLQLRPRKPRSPQRRRRGRRPLRLREPRQRDHQPFPPPHTLGHRQRAKRRASVDSPASTSRPGTW